MFNWIKRILAPTISTFEIESMEGVALMFEEHANPRSTLLQGFVSRGGNGPCCAIVTDDPDQIDDLSEWYETGRPFWEEQPDGRTACFWPWITCNNAHLHMEYEQSLHLY